MQDQLKYGNPRKRPHPVSFYQFRRGCRVGTAIGVHRIILFIYDIVYEQMMNIVSLYTKQIFVVQKKLNG